MSRVASNAVVRPIMTKRWWRKTEPLYRRFSHLGRDAAEAEEMFKAETYGKAFVVSPTNRYLAGKRNMDATVAMWREDIGGNAILTKAELRDDKTFWGVKWWIDSILPRIRGRGALHAARASVPNRITNS